MRRARSVSPSSYQPIRQVGRDGWVQRVDDRGALEDRARLVVPPLFVQRALQPVQRVAHVRVLVEHLAQHSLRARRVARVAIQQQKSLGRARPHQPRLQLQGALDRRARPIHGLRGFLERLGDRELGMGLRELRVERDRPLQLLARTLRVAPVQQCASGEVMLVGIEVGLVTDVGLRHHLRGDRTRYSARDLGLDLEDVLQLPVERLAPDLHALRIEQLRRHPQLIPRLAHAPLQHVVHAQERADPLDPVVTALERERGGAPDHIEPGRSCEPIEDLLGDAVAEILVGGVLADVRERQHRNRVLEAAAVAFPCRIGPPRSQRPLASRAPPARRGRRALMAIARRPQGSGSRGAPADCGSAASPAAAGAVRRIPPGPISNSQPKTTATGSPSTAAQISARMAASGMPNPGNISAATCSASQAPTTYSAAVRKTLRRRASRKSRMTACTVRFGFLIVGTAWVRVILPAGGPRKPAGPVRGPDPAVRSPSPVDLSREAARRSWQPIPRHCSGSCRRRSRGARAPRTANRCP